MCGFVICTDKKITKKSFKESLKKISHRGPDMTKIKEEENIYIGFNRLSIMGLNESGMQPFTTDKYISVCNGEIYGFRKIKDELIKKGYKFKSESDCEILIPLYIEKKEKMFKQLDSEFVCAIYDKDKKSLIVGRDPIGIRPLFYGYTKNNKICFASEAKALIEICEKIKPFPIGHYYKDGHFYTYNNIVKRNTYIKSSIEEITKNIHDLLIKAVEKRLDSDAPIGFLLSGGLDSSLVCSIASKKLKTKIRTFAIGMDKDAIDLKYAKQVAEYIGSIHTEVIITKEDVLNSLKEVIYYLETYDITTIRASLGMYLLCKYIKNNTDIKVLLTGEVSDELFGYKYTDFAPNSEEFQKESEKRVKELYMYDVLRADRCIAANSLEARVPFADLDFVKYVLSIDPSLKMNKNNIGKYLLRKSFEKDYLPKNILYREKAAFSDAVGHSMVDDLKEFAENYYTDSEFEKEKKKYKNPTPFTKEALLYRQIFESYYKGMSSLVKDYWMPNKNWENCDVQDPSARVLKNYGKSGE